MIIAIHYEQSVMTRSFVIPTLVLEHYLKVDHFSFLIFALFLKFYSFFVIFPRIFSPNLLGRPERNAPLATPLTTIAHERNC